MHTELSYEFYLWSLAAKILKQHGDTAAGERATEEAHAYASEYTTKSLNSLTREMGEHILRLSA